MLSDCHKATSEELFRTSKGASYQCDVTNRIILKFDDFELSLRIQQFQCIRRSLNQIDIKGRIFDLSDESDHFFVEAPMVNFREKLTLCEIIQLRELVNGTYFALELNSMLHKLLGPERALIYKTSN
ncbi:MAG: hypothetical protein ABS46_04275 [Cytophagaceae bacterium SCN 52-12]|nr:MAG: hypothetical protein ABS46_04275 [Cytophagaceae bacterium SCN 52-12]